MKNDLNINEKYNLLLLLLAFIYVFVIGLIDIDELRNNAYRIVFTIIYIVAAKVITGGIGKKFFTFAGLAIALFWMAEFMHLEIVSWISFVVSIIFLSLIIFKMILRITKSETVGLLEFVEAINAYILLGIIGSILFKIVYELVPSTSFKYPSENLLPNVDFIYFSFVTLTSVGYGDITPIDPVAKSLSIFLGVIGQLYLALTIALLVGKYLSAKQREN